MNTRHITRFTYQFTNFQGWRVAITRQGVALARYFSDRQYGDADAAWEHARSFRDMVLAELSANPAQTQAILMKHRVQPKRVYPAGLKPAAPTSATESTETPACSMRSNKVLHGILRNMCKRLQLDTASVLKLSLYVFMLQYGTPGALATPVQKQQIIHAGAALQENAEPDLQLLIAELENRALQAGLPCFEEFATGRNNRQAPQLYNTADALPDQHVAPLQDTTGACDNSHAAERYMRSARPSPPQCENDTRSRLHTHLSNTSSSTTSTAAFPGHSLLASEAILAASPLLPGSPPTRKKVKRIPGAATGSI